MHKPNRNSIRNGRDKREIRSKSRFFFKLSVLGFVRVVMTFVAPSLVIINQYCMSQSVQN